MYANVFYPIKLPRVNYNTFAAGCSVQENLQVIR